MYLIINDMFPTGTEVFVAESGNSAINILKNISDIDLCICDHVMPDGMGGIVLKYLYEMTAKAKFVLCSTISTSDCPTDYPPEKIYDSILKPDIVEGIDRLWKRLEKNFVEKKNISNEFTSVSLNVLALMGKVPSDMYIRMSDNKFVKCINRFEEFSSIDKENYHKKLIDILYMKKNDQDSDIKELVLNSVQEILNRKNLPLADKLIFSHSQLVGLIKFTGITPDLAEITKNNIQQSVEFMMKSPVVIDFWKKINHLGEYPSRLYSLQAMLSSVIVKKLQWYSEATIYKLSLAAFLQDIALDSIELMEIRDYSEFLELELNFSKSDVKLYLDHPIIASEIVSSFKNIPPDINTLLLEQHEMPDGKGFPRKLTSSQLGPLSCVFIISGLFARQVIKDGSLFVLKDFIAKLEEKGFSKGNFKDAFAVIKAME